jgi:hypothetical protein
MSEFTQKLRHFCRNTRCRMKLREPVGSEREAFCCRGCYESFYLRRCRVCGKALADQYRKIKPKSDGKPIRFIKVRNTGPTCGSAECARRWRRKDNIGRYSAPRAPSGYRGSRNADLCSKVPAAQAQKCDLPKPTPRHDRRWRVIAGPPLNPSQLHCATIPDGQTVDRVPTWQGGEYERIENRNKAMLRKRFREQVAGCLIQPHHPPVNVLGGYRFPGAPGIDLKPVPEQQSVAPKSPTPTFDSDALEIPEFLRRNPLHPIAPQPACLVSSQVTSTAPPARSVRQSNGSTAERVRAKSLRRDAA